MSTHPLLCPALLSKCANTIVREALPPGQQKTLDNIGKKHSWAAALDTLQGTNFASVVVDDGIVILDSNFKPLPSISRERFDILEALAVVQRTAPVLFDLLNAYVVGIVSVCRTCPEPPALDSSIDVIKATHGLWQPEKGHFVGSSTGHLGILWIEADLMPSDIVCGVVHEFAHFMLNLTDMATGVFTEGAYDGSLCAVSPILKTPRPYALAMHALMVQSVLNDLGLRMSTDPPEAFDFERAAASLSKSAHLALTGNGMALFKAVRSHQLPQGAHPKLQLTGNAVAVQTYVARHSSPTLLFWGGGETYSEELELCFELSDTGVLVINGVDVVKRTTVGAYGNMTVREQKINGPSKMSILEHFKRRRAAGRGYGRRADHAADNGSYSETIFGLGELTVEHPWNTNYVDISARLDCLNETWHLPPFHNETYSTLRLPCGQLHAEANANIELTVAEAFRLPPPQLVTVHPEFRGDAIHLVCLSALSGTHLAELSIDNAATTTFQDVRRDLADRCGVHPPGAARFVTAAGRDLTASASAETLETLFRSQTHQLESSQLAQDAAKVPSRTSGSEISPDV